MIFFVNLHAGVELFIVGIGEIEDETTVMLSVVLAQWRHLIKDETIAIMKCLDTLDMMNKFLCHFLFCIIADHGALQ